jgi:DNA-binding NtrC family response regulator
MTSVKSRCIALVEPDARLRRAFTRVLTDDFDVVALSSAEDLLDAIDAGTRFDLVLAELSLPGASGIDLLSVLLDRNDTTARRLVLMTALDVRPSTFSVPVLLKPFDVGAMRMAFHVVTSNAGDSGGLTRSA